MYIAFSILIIYLLLIIAFIVGFDKIAVFKNNNSSPKNTFSVVIPFRNEAPQLPRLLNSLYAIDYPKELFEILLVNDDSQDAFRPIIDEFQNQYPEIKLSLIEASPNSVSPKKNAINTAIEHSNFDWIITTDADCKLPVSWLLLFNQFIEEKHALFISAPVKFKEERSLLFHFQNLHFISLIGSTIGGFGLKKPFMCNGANLCYHKDTFIKLNGFEGNTAIASGDDIFLLEKMNRKYPDKIGYLKSIEAMVETSAVPSWTQFMNQQIRWVSKSASYKNRFATIVGITVVSINLMLAIIGVLTIIFPHFLSYFLSLLALKSIADLVLIFKTSYFLKIKNPLKYFLGICLLYPFFIVFIGGLSLYKSYIWKGRIFKK
jgi:cellulose synthase/poly-beta-1,6-N-acetylglucosamine synthase-like glycosyltransferase